MSLSVSATDALSARGTQGFTFAQGLGIGTTGLVYSHDLYLSAGGSFVRTTEDSPIDLFPRSDVRASAVVSVYPPLLSSAGPGAVASGLISVSVPSPFAHQVVELGVNASYNGLGGAFYQVTNPRGAFDPVVQNLPGRTLVSIDYQIPIALLDVPLVYSLGLVGIGCSFHLEAAADWAGTPGTFSPDQDLYAGAEVLLAVSAESNRCRSAWESR